MALSLQEKVRVRYHLGYPNTDEAASMQLGMIRSADTSYLVELAMNNLRPEAEDLVRDLIKTVDCIECVQRGEAIDRMAAQRIGNLALNTMEPEALQNENERWSKRLADALGVMVYPYGSKFKGVGRKQIGSIRRR